MRKSYIVTYVPCTACGASGRIRGFRCRTCNGAAKMPVTLPEERYTITLPGAKS